MSHNPLLGSRISLISKKSIRYEGTLYSISESDATVALQNVRTYGTEGREGEAQFVPPQEGVVHPYLLFRGCDIKDLHVHENKDADKDAKKDADKNDITTTAGNPDDGDSSGGSNGKTEKIKTPAKSPNSATAASTDVPVERKEEDTDKKDRRRRRRSTSQSRDSIENVGEEDKTLERTKEEKSMGMDRKERGINRKEKEEVITPTAMSAQQPNNGSSHLHNNTTNNSNTNNKGTSINNKGRMLGNRRGKRDPKQMVGTGASLLRRKARGAVEGVAGPDKNTPQEDYDFQSNLAVFDKSNATEDPNYSSDINNEEIYDEEEDEEIINEGRFGTTNGGGGGGGGGSSVYTKDDFFDSISSDVLDKKNGIDNRLRGSAERNLNTETFGAVSLGNGRRGG
eukprot:CAMPEP_0198249864 /NCGR_PEP_ID=MMETSP1447-20131203/1245_1 /TAXON_ID=420782 /ORGANISM="Chaetoceros dichaeta, Strain CCMP1751" /LENGTH=396 /DNA_ID=CAMNT_0043934589 /DNA_START=59 /DNA_END=1246 /DNA_ORIENTATION=+